MLPGRSTAARGFSTPLASSFVALFEASRSPLELPRPGATRRGKGIHRGLYTPRSSTLQAQTGASNGLALQDPAQGAPGRGRVVVSQEAQVRVVDRGVRHERAQQAPGHGEDFAEDEAHQRSPSDPPPARPAADLMEHTEGNGR